MTIEVKDQVAQVGDFVDYSVYCDTCQTPDSLIDIEKSQPEFLGGRLELPQANNVARQHELALGEGHYIRIEGMIHDDYEEDFRDFWRHS